MMAFISYTLFPRNRSLFEQVNFGDGNLIRFLNNVNPNTLFDIEGLNLLEKSFDISEIVVIEFPFDNSSMKEIHPNTIPLALGIIDKYV